MPDIFQIPRYFIDSAETVAIPDFVPEEPEQPLAALRDREEGDTRGEWIAEEEEGDAERRSGQRRQAGRRADDDLSLEVLKQRYRERLDATKEEFFAEIREDLLGDLRRQMQAVRDEAYRAELLSQRQSIRERLDQVEQGMQRLELSHKSYMMEFTEELKFMALEIAEKLLHKEINEDPAALEEMVVQLISEVKNASWINVEVSDQVSGLAEHLRKQLSKAEQGVPVYVSVKDAPPDAVRIDTAEGVIDATLSVQLRQLRQAFMEAQEEGVNA